MPSEDNKGRSLRGKHEHEKHENRSFSGNCGKYAPHLCFSRIILVFLVFSLFSPAVPDNALGRIQTPISKFVATKNSICVFGDHGKMLRVEDLPNTKYSQYLPPTTNNNINIIDNIFYHVGQSQR